MIDDVRGLCMAAQREQDNQDDYRSSFFITVMFLTW